VPLIYPPERVEKDREKGTSFFSENRRKQEAEWVWLVYSEKATKAVVSLFSLPVNTVGP
jgi:hypothetical protein